MKTMKIPSPRMLLAAFLTIAITGIGLANDLKGKHTREKTIKKEYTVNPNALLKINNSYGNLILSSWNEDRIVIEVHITVNGNKESNVEQKLDEIIGREKQIDSGAWVIPLPHSSGASRWHQTEENRILIEKAVALIADHYDRLFPGQ